MKARKIQVLIPIWVVALLVSACCLAGCVIQSRGPQSVDVYGLNERLSGPVKSPPGVLGRMIGMCNFDSYYVRIDRVDHCLVLNGGRNGALVTVNITHSEHDIFIDEPTVATLRDLAAKLEELTSARSRHLVLSANRQPVALVPVTVLNGAGGIRVRTFDD